MVNDLAVRHGMTVAVVRAMIDDLFRCLGEELAREGKVQVRGFGAWRLVQIPSRVHRNPATGKACEPRSAIDIRFRSGIGLARRCGAMRHRHHQGDPSKARY